MHIETIGNVVAWSGEFHRNFATFIESSVAASDDERTKMLSGYIADHERQLAKRCPLLIVCKVIMPWGRGALSF